MKKGSETSEAVSASSSEESLLAIRRAKADKARAAAQNPFANDVDTRDRILIHTIRERCEPALLEPKDKLKYDPDRVLDSMGEDAVHVCGRLIARRGFGKVSFLKLRDGSAEIQLFAKEETLGTGLTVLDDIDIADHIEVKGPVIVTKTGELSIEVHSLRLLSKALRPLPDKWHGLTDVELRYRQRYVDLVANPDAAVVLRARTIIIQALRDFLDRDGFLEVETPTLNSLVGGALARPFTTHHNALDLNLFLRIAPELYLKRFLVGGFERVYEIGRCYRNEGLSTRHNPEFTMVEFYQAYATYETLMLTAEHLLRHIDAALAEKLAALGLSSHYERWIGERPYTLSEPFARVGMEAGLRHSLEKAALPWSIVAQFEALGQAKEDTTPSVVEIGQWIKDWKTKSPRAAKIDWSNFRRALGHTENAGERLFIAYEYIVEPFLTEDYRSQKGDKSVPVFIMDYPAESSPLARRKESDPSLVDRFELFVDGRELCNAFSELNDPDDQAARFREQVARKGRGAEEAMDYDEDYIRALEHGMPPAAGFGMGVDRLVMTLAVQPSIRDVIGFPLLRPEALK
jgi:lysyl-tRNA synthetase class 2